VRITPSAIVNLSPLEIARNPARVGQTRAARLKGELGTTGAREITRRILQATLRRVDIVA
jgi:hypothetical protein